MMCSTSINNYHDVVGRCKKSGNIRIAVAAAHDSDVLKAVKTAEEMGLATAILVGNGPEITSITRELGITNAEILHETDDIKACQTAVTLIKQNKANILMKGLVNSSNFLRAVLEFEDRKSEAILSHLGAFEIPHKEKLLFMTDGGMNINPDLKQKKAILINAVSALIKLGIDSPKVALLAANEKVHQKMQSAVDAQELVHMRDRGEIPFGMIEGPIALDVAISREAAEHKGIRSNISGDVDLYLVPNIDAGNIWGKSLIYYSGAIMAGLVIGADYPIVLTSRAETPEGKLNSIALACLMVNNDNQQKNDS